MIIYLKCINEGLKINVFVDHWKGIQRFNMFKKNLYSLILELLIKIKKKFILKKCLKVLLKLPVTQFYKK